MQKVNEMNQEYKITTQITNELLSVNPETEKYLTQECVVQLIKLIPSEKLHEIFEIDFVDVETAYKRSGSFDFSISEREYWYYIFCKLRD